MRITKTSCDYKKIKQDEIRQDNKHKENENNNKSTVYFYDI